DHCRWSGHRAGERVSAAERAARTPPLTQSRGTGSNGRSGAAHIVLDAGDHHRPPADFRPATTGRTDLRADGLYGRLAAAWLTAVLAHAGAASVFVSPQPQFAR